jgi:hypothetical protein
MSTEGYAALAQSLLNNILEVKVSRRPLDQLAATLSSQTGLQ